MSDPIESDSRILAAIKGDPRNPRRNLPVVALEAAERRALEHCHRMPALVSNSRVGCMIGGPAWSFPRALGFERCLLLDGRIVRCQHDATREEHLL